LLILGALVGCIGRETRGAQFYAGAQRPPDQVARLIGPITVVDGRKVNALGGSLELLPGCHVVEIGGRVGQVDPRQGGWAATLPHLVYVFPMRAGYSYVIEVQRDPALGFGPHGTGRIVAFEQDAQGRSTYLGPVRDRSEVDACFRNE
jgi:hypothetical protein